LQQLIEAKMKGVTIEPRAVSTPSPVIDLMAALKRSLAQEPPAPEQRTAKRKQTKKAPDQRQPTCRRSSKRGAVVYGITNRNLLAIRRRGSVSCGPRARSVIIASAAPPQIIPNP
jgi:hypothetical protein